MDDGFASSAQAGGWIADQLAAWLAIPRLRLSALIRCLLLAVAGAAALWVIGTAVRFYVRDYYTFLPDYIRWMCESAPAGQAERTPTHVFLLFVDHFEPDFDVESVVHWTDRYRALATRHRDSDGRPPQHTWFYPGEQESAPILDTLQRMTASGFGEVELHFHHDYDTYDTLKPRLANAISVFQRRGFLRTVDGKTRFAFIHGNSGLDNSNGPVMCGVNEELRLLRELGCFADFTFPSVYEPAQPPMVNSIYAARDDASPQSYRHRLPLDALSNGAADLMIFEGPLLFAPSLSLRHLFLDLDDGDIHGAVPPSPTRADRWLRANVHVQGRPDWVFVKLFAHGVSTADDEEASVGSAFDETLTYLEHTYNDSQHYVLHYVTARQAYNLAMAAAAHVTGPPEQYYDYLIKPYVADGATPAPRPE